MLYLKLPVEQGLQALKELTFPHHHNFEFPCLSPLHSILPLFQPFHQLHSLSQVLGKNRGRYCLCKSFLRLPLFYTALLELARSAFGSHLLPPRDIMLATPWAWTLDEMCRVACRSEMWVNFQILVWGKTQLNHLHLNMFSILKLSEKEKLAGLKINPFSIMSSH